MCVNVLRAVDLLFAGVFFPTPGFSPPKAARREAMLELVRQSRADFDGEDYLRDNYYLR
jgi:hypothetical protein